MSFTQQHRVLIYTTCYNVLDGVTLTIRKLEQEILDAGHSVRVLTTKSGDPANTHLDGTHPNRDVLFLDNSIPIPFLHDPNNPQSSYQLGFSLSKSIVRKLDEFEPTVIHITVADLTAIHIIEYAREKQIPLMGTYHSNIPDYMDHYPGLRWLKPFLGSFFRHQYNFFQSLFVPTPYIKDCLIRTYNMDKFTRLQIWGRGVDVEKFNPDNANPKFRAQLGIAPDAVIVCWVGRLVPEKRPDIFCDTIRRLHKKNVPFHAIVIGAGPSEDEIRALPNTTFCGWMTPEQLAVAYASCDVFLFPSSVETFGNVTLEAMASGLPVIVEAGCSGHLVDEGVNGYACPAGDFDAFFEATHELVRNTELRRRCSHNSRQRSLGLEKRTVVRQMLDNYQKVTHEFFTHYAGRHENRDEAYQFRCGNHPMPYIMAATEWLVIVILWNVTGLTLMLQMCVARLTRNTQGLAPLKKVELSVPTVESAPRERVVASEEPTRTKLQAKISQDRSTLRPSPAPSVETADETGSDSSSTDPLLSPSVSEDDLSAITEDEEPRATTEEVKQCRPTMKFTLGDLAMAIALSIVNFVEFGCRQESRLRNGVSSCYTCASKGRYWRKRKDSFDEHMGGEIPTITELATISTQAPGQRMRRLAVVETVEGV